MSEEEARGRKRICQLNDCVDFRTAKKKIKGMENLTGLNILRYEDGRPVVSISVYREACVIMAKM